MAERIDEVVISAAMNAKINGRHRVTKAEVEQALNRRGNARWHTDDQDRRRLLMTGGTDEGRRLGIVLFPTAVVGVWRLGSAFPLQT